ncbi:MAG: hypothetical protein D6689_20700, partial [Deltaproteobacteria bacterium]
ALAAAVGAALALAVGAAALAVPVGAAAALAVPVGAAAALACGVGGVLASGAGAPVAPDASRRARRSAPQCLHRRAMRWTSPPHAGHGT